MSVILSIRDAWNAVALLIGQIVLLGFVSIFGYYIMKHFKTQKCPNCGSRRTGTVMGMSKYKKVCAYCSTFYDPMSEEEWTTYRLKNRFCADKVEPAARSNISR